MTISQAFPFVHEALIAFGFPDIFFEQDDVFIKFLNKLTRDHCDVVLGLFPSDRPDKADMVDIDTGGKIKNIVIKPQQTDLRYTWGSAIWAPVFTTRFMHRYLEAYKPSAAQKKELFIGEVVREAIAEGLRVEAAHIADEAFLDIGTPEDLLKVATHLLARTEKNHC